MKRYRAFEVKYVPMTDTKPSRIRIKDLHHGDSVLISNKYSEISTQAESLLEESGISLCGIIILDGMCLLLTDEFEKRINGSHV